MDTFKTPDGYEYETDEYGVIHQVNPEPFVYDPEYVSTYDSAEYALNSRALCGIRIGVVLDTYVRIFGTSKTPESLLDFGCGNGAFGEYASTLVNTVYGFDILDYPLPEQVIGCSELIEADVYTFWDSLEHCPDLDFMEGLDCKMVAISLPWCHFSPNNHLWFSKWKHRKPNEHLHHFSALSLIQFMDSKGWKCVHTCSVEDVIRTPIDASFNILTAIFIKDGRP